MHFWTRSLSEFLDFGMDLYGASGLYISIISHSCDLQPFTYTISNKKGELLP